MIVVVVRVILAIVSRNPSAIILSRANVITDSRSTSPFWRELVCDIGISIRSGYGLVAR